MKTERLLRTMKRMPGRIAGMALAAALVGVSAAGHGQSGGDYVISKSTTDSGGGESSGGAYALTGTIGQPDANPQLASAGEFTLAGGFWASEILDLIFKDGFEEL